MRKSSGPRLGEKFLDITKAQFIKEKIDKRRTHQIKIFLFVKRPMRTIP